MSAFLVSTDCMDRCVAAICNKGRYEQTIRIFAGQPTDTVDARQNIGRMLYAMNDRALTARYGAEPSGLAETYMPRAIGKTTLTVCLKSLQCLAYQCSEGDEPETALFKDLHAAIGEVAIAIVEATQAYSAAAWD